MIDLKKREDVSFFFFFQRGSEKRYDLGKMNVAFIPNVSKTPGEAQLKFNLLIDSPVKILNGRISGIELINTQFMNLLDASYSSQDIHQIIASRLTFNSTEDKLIIEETLRLNGEEKDKPITNIFIKGPAQIYDCLSLLYKLRAIELRQAEIVSLAVYYDQKLYPVLVEYAYLETVDFRKSRFECRVYKLSGNNRELPILKQKIKIQSARVWVTNDANSYLVKFQIESDEGRFFGELNLP